MGRLSARRRSPWGRRLTARGDERGRAEHFVGDQVDLVRGDRDQCTGRQRIAIHECNRPDRGVENGLPDLQRREGGGGTAALCDMS
jgi:hypothetical protein